MVLKATEIRSLNKFAVCLPDTFMIVQFYQFHVVSILPTLFVFFTVKIPSYRILFKLSRSSYCNSICHSCVVVRTIVIS